jgi:hypothetical protein
MVPERTHSRANPARGVALIATAVIVGVFVLRNGWDQGTPDVASTSSEAPAGSEGGTAAPPSGAETTASTAPPRAPNEVIVRVLNAAGVQGAATGWSDALAADGYQIAEAGNAPETRDATAVLFIAGYDREAAAVAQAIGAPADGVAAIGNPPTADAANAHVVVLLGTDIANNAPDAG